MSEARRGLAAVTDWPDYVQIVGRLIREGAEALGAKSLVILADEKTRRVLSKEVMTGLEQDLAVQLSWVRRLYGVQA